MQQGRYLDRLIELCSDERFGQDAVEWAIMSGWVELSYDLEADLRMVMGEPGHPERGRYDRICESYRRHCAQMEQPVELEFAVA